MENIKAMFITLGVIILGVVAMALGAILIPVILALVSALIAGGAVYFVYIIVLEATREQ